MIKFFKKIRKKLIDKNQFRKYLFYAIGEIILVIIGILIALAIDNNNDKNKNEERFKYQLTQISSELKNNIERTRKGILYYENLDSRFSSIMSDTLEAEDLRTNDGYYFTNVIFNSFKSSITRNNFEQIAQNNNHVDESYNRVIEELNNLYLIKEKQLLQLDERLKNLTDENETKLENQKTWFYHYLWTDKVSDDAAKYFINDSIYKNRIAGYYKLSRGHLRALKEYRVKAIECYSEINNLLKPENNNELISLGYSVSDIVLKNYVGIYNFKKLDTTIITLENGKLFAKIIQRKNSFKSQLHPISNNEFFIIDGHMIIEFPVFLENNTDELIWKMFGVNYRFSKVKNNDG